MPQSPAATSTSRLHVVESASTRPGSRRRPVRLDSPADPILRPAHPHADVQAEAGLRHSSSGYGTNWMPAAARHLDSATTNLAGLDSVSPSPRSNCAKWTANAGWPLTTWTTCRAIARSRFLGRQRFPAFGPRSALPSSPKIRRIPRPATSTDRVSVAGLAAARCSSNNLRSNVETGAETENHPAGIGRPEALV